MRKYALSLALWLVRRFNLDLLGEHRIRNGSDAVERGARWEGFWLEENGLADMLSDMKQGYLTRAGEQKASDTQAVWECAARARMVEELEARVRSVIHAGKIEAANIEQQKVFSLPPHRRSVG